MEKDGIEEEIKDFLSTKGIPIMGISAISQLPRVPEDFFPDTILKGAKSFICYGVPIPKGIIKANRHNMALYWRYCNMLYRSLDITSNQLCLLVERKGHLAIPVYGCYPWKVEGQKFWGILPLVYWAEETGLGKITKCGLLATSEYGTRILFGGAVTTLALKPSKKLSDEICPSECFDCVNVCPVQAIEQTGNVDHNACIRYLGDNPLMSQLLSDKKMKERFSFETIVNTVGVDDHGTYSCNECLKVCPLNNR
jgi:epoxyqueuosine reductase QueG